MEIPQDRKYAKSHEWARTDIDGSVLVGITDFAQEALGDVVFVDLPAVGKSFAAGQAIAVVESVKAASDIYAPVAGEVREVNESLRDAPEGINGDPWGTWLLRLQPSAPADLPALLDAAGYAAHIEASH
jgi:glycine cleavage system H protein